MRLMFAIWAASGLCRRSVGRSLAHLLTQVARRWPGTRAWLDRADPDAPVALLDSSKNRTAPSPTGPTDRMTIYLRGQAPRMVPIVTAAEQPLLGRAPRRGWVIVGAGLLTCGSSLRPAFPCPETQWHLDRRSPLTVAGAVQDLPATGAPGSRIKPLSRHHDTAVLRRSHTGCQGWSALVRRSVAPTCPCRQSAFPFRRTRKHSRMSPWN